MVEEALAVAEVVVVVVEDLEEEVVALEVEVDDMTIRKKHLYYLIHIVLTLYEVSRLFHCMKTYIRMLSDVFI